MLLKGNELPNHTFKAKKILCPICMDYKKIHTCLNDCILHQKECKILDDSLKCGASHANLRKIVS